MDYPITDIDRAAAYLTTSEVILKNLPQIAIDSVEFSRINIIAGICFCNGATFARQLQNPKVMRKLMEDEAFQGLLKKLQEERLSAMGD